MGHLLGLVIFVSTGCPASIGPEVAVAAAAACRTARCVLVGDLGTLRRAAELKGVSRDRLVPFTGTPPEKGRIAVTQPGPRLSARDRKPGQPTRASGAAQLEYVEEAFRLARRYPASSLATAPVSKSVIASSGRRGAASFLGHTEWLQRLDGAPSSTMCFVAKRLVVSLATTHIPLSRVAREVTGARVCEATVQLARLLHALGHERPHVAVCSLNPHAGESALLGAEESRAIVPGMTAAREALGGAARIAGPIGAETAFRKAYAGGYRGVVALYHDQATIPLKLVAFGKAVNVTMGLSVLRTSVDHGTAYDIAWRGTASPDGMMAAIRLAHRLGRFHGQRR